MAMDEAGIWTGMVVDDVLGTHGGNGIAFTTISTDTRTLQRGALCIVLHGPRFDGHRFLDAARDAGARGAVVRRGTPPVPGLVMFEVDDPLLALGGLARYRRRLIAGPVVAVTGTNGKTSTKEMIVALLRTRWPTHGTRDNRNNRVGVPLTILEAPADCEAMVVEAGANERGEIGQLRDIVEPTIGVITNVAAGHLEGFDTLDGVLAEKLSLLPGAQRAIVGMVPRDLGARAREIVPRVTTAGLSREADVHPERWSVDSEGRGIVRYRGREVRLPVLGQHQVENAMIAIATGLESGVDVEAGLAALESVVGLGGRCEVLQRGSLTILNDTYNANPASLQASLDTIRDFRGGRSVAILVGTMLELGRDARRHHLEMARAVVAAEPNLIGVVGEFVPAFAEVERSPDIVLLTAEDPERLGRVVASHLRGDEVVLLKASRGVQLERAIPYLNPGSESPCSTIS